VIPSASSSNTAGLSTGFLSAERKSAWVDIVVGKETEDEIKEEREEEEDGEEGEGL
jgi:hypothetical protein